MIRQSSSRLDVNPIFAADIEALRQRRKNAGLSGRQTADNPLNVQFDTFLTFLTGVMLGLDPSIQAI
ncbi:hypothetical protein V6767_21110 [Martelella sp. FLE1502]